MDLGCATFISISVCAIFVQLADAQPTIQQSSIPWRPDPAARCDNNLPHADSRSPTLQNAIDLVLLELQRHSSEAEDLQREMRSIQHKSDENRVLLKQLSDSLDLLVKKFIKSPGCDCAGLNPLAHATTGAESAGGCTHKGVNKGEDGERGGDGVGSGGRARDFDDLDGYQRIPNTIPGAYSDSSYVARNDERVLMDAKGSASAGTGNSVNSGGSSSIADDLSVPRPGESRHKVDGDVDDGDDTATPGSGATSETTTLAPDPIYQLYNGSVPKDCEDVKNLGYSRNGTYFIKPTLSKRSLPVLCEFLEHEVWTLIQRRQDGTVDFYRTWDEYKVGFGDISGEFWLGNDVLYHLTNQDYYRLRIDMWDWPRNTAQGKRLDAKYYFAESSYFFVDNETYRYALHVPNDYFAFTGFGGSGLRVHAGPFLTKDVQELPEGMRQNCAEKFHCGWWFTTCVRNANFNGRYYKGGYSDEKKKRRARDDIYWPNIEQSLQKVVMKISRVNESYAFGSYQ